MGGGRAAGLADADADSAGGELGEVLCRAAQGRETRPGHDRGADDDRPMPALGQARDGNP